jgi:L-ribulose-5-phosphate 4-epimerase
VSDIGATPRDAVKAAVMCEDVARIVHIARQLSTPVPTAAEHIDQLYDRYQNVYGQR